MNVRIAPTLAASVCAVIFLATSCAGGPERVRAIEGAQLPGGPGENASVVVEYKGSDTGAPIPYWVGKKALQLESMVDNNDYYMFLEAGVVESYDSVIAKIREYRAAEETKNQIVTRVLEKCAGIKPLPGDLLKDTIQLIEVTEYVGLRRQDDFWACECTNYGEKKEAAALRYRYWILYSIPKDQVNAGLSFAYQSVAPRFPPQTQSESAAIDLLLDRFRDGL